MMLRRSISNMNRRNNLNPLWPNTQSPSTKSSSINKKNSRWLTRFLEARIFLRLPAKNLQELISQLEEINISKGSSIIAPNQSADYFYILKEGQVDINWNHQSFTTLDEGNGFGEDLLSDNHSYLLQATAISDCTLSRMSKDNFIRLLVTPIVETVASHNISNKDIILDTNTNQQHNDNTQHLPYPYLRAQHTQLNKNVRYVVTHNNHGIRKSCAFLLSQLGYEAVVLEGELEPAISANSEQIAEQAIASEIAELESQMKSLNALEVGEDIEENSPAPKNTSIVCVERDDEQLWTPIPAHLRPEGLNILKTQEEKNPLAPRTQPKKKLETSDIEEAEGWLSDEYVWEKVLGFDRTPEVDALIEESSELALESKTNNKENNTAQTSKPNIPLSNGIHIKLKEEQPEKPAPTPKPYINKVEKKNSKLFYSVTALLAIAIAVAPFVAPNTFNSYYDQITKTMNSQDMEKMVVNITSFSLDTFNSADETVVPTQPTLTPEMEKKVALEHAKTSAKAEFERKLSMAKAKPAPATIPVQQTEEIVTAPEETAPELTPQLNMEPVINIEEGATNDMIIHPSQIANPSMQHELTN